MAKLELESTDLLSLFKLIDVDDSGQVPPGMSGECQLLATYSICFVVILSRGEFQLACCATATGYDGEVDDNDDHEVSMQQQESDCICSAASSSYSFRSDISLSCLRSLRSFL